MDLSSCSSGCRWCVQPCALRAAPSLTLLLVQPALYGLSLFSFSFGARRAIDSRIGGPTDASPPQGDGVYVRRSVHAFDSKGVSVGRHGVSDEHELSRSRRALPPMRIKVQQQSVVEYEEPDLELGEGEGESSRGLERSAPGEDWRRECKSWDIQPAS